jgi:hypothetical protein
MNKKTEAKMTNKNWQIWILVILVIVLCGAFISVTAVGIKKSLPPNLPVQGVWQTSWESIFISLTVIFLAIFLSLFPFLMVFSLYTGQHRERLWVRETWRRYGDGIAYRADYGDASFADEVHAPWKPSIHMPRCLSRITLEITGVRVERLKDISADDAYDEGAADWAAETQRNGNKWPNIVRAYQGLWESINGPGSWDANPWVWVLSFRRLPS